VSTTTAREPVGNPADDPIGYVQRNIWPPLPTAFGVWLGDLIHRAAAGADPDLELAVPDAVLATGVFVPLCRKDGDTIVVTLGRALTLFGLEELLFPDDEEHAADPIAVFEPLVALTLANTADAQTVADTYDPATVAELAATLAAGDWEYHLVPPIRVDGHGRLVTGLNTLLAIVKANAPAPAMAYYDTDDTGTVPLTWRGPAGWNNGAPHDTA
jgi:hypothetical protein